MKRTTAEERRQSTAGVARQMSEGFHHGRPEEQPLDRAAPLLS